MDTRTNLEDKILQYKRFKYDNHGYLNTKTMHTFEKVFEHFTNHLTSVVHRSSEVKLLEVEIPQAETAAQAIKDNQRTRLDRRVLPRAISMWNIDVNQEHRAQIPNLQDLPRINHGVKVALCTIKRKNKKDNKGYNYMRDIDMMITGSPRFSTATMFYNILVNEKLEAIELAKVMKFMFPLQFSKPMYAEYTRTGVHTEAIIKDYTLETLLPDELVNDLKKIFDITDTGTDGDLELLKVLQEHSKEEIDYSIDGANRKRAFIIKYPHKMILTPTTIELVEFEKSEQSRTYGVKMEFQLDWIEYAMYGLTATFAKLNMDAPSKQVGYDPAKPENVYGYVEIPLAKFSEQLNGCTIIEECKLTYNEEDVVVNKTEEEDKSWTEVSIYDVIEDELLLAYVRDLVQCNVEITDFFNIECQRGYRRKDIPTKQGMDYNILIDWDAMTFIDEYGKPGQKVYIALYVNKKNYNDWLLKNGYRSSSNLSAYN